MNVMKDVDDVGREGVGQEEGDGQVGGIGRDREGLRGEWGGGFESWTKGASIGQMKQKKRGNSATGRP